MLTPRAAAFLLLALSRAPACTVPVFRYALDRWPAETWTLEAPRTAFTTEPLATALRNLGGNSPLNLSAKPWPDSTQKDARLSFPATGDPGTAWTGPLTPESLAQLVDSPARQELARRILSGDSLVWVIVQSADAAANDALTARIQKRLTFVQNAAELPAIDPDDPSSRLGPGPELKLQFSQFSVRRDEKKEAAFIAMLAGPQGGAMLQAGAPFAAVVFGRGRVFGAWPVDELTDERLDQTNLFVTRACSCEVKSLHPGWDLLMNVDWDDALRKAQDSRNAPPTALLTGPPPSATPVLVPIAPGIAPAAPAEPKSGWPLVAGIAALIVTVAGIFFIRRKPAL